jgi:hypothetical protein
MQESTTGPDCRNIIKVFLELLENGKGDYTNQEQMARAIELGKFLSSVTIMVTMIMAVNMYQLLL